MAVPPNPVPPIASVYAAVPPAFTVADAELPDATARPKSVVPPVPLRAAVCGVLKASSTICREAVREPAADGLNVMLTEQVAAAARLAPQLLV
jgi:hypothetical protein